MVEVAAIDPRDITVTPVFRLMEIENIPKSEEQGHLVKELHEVVQVRFAGSTNYSPIMPANAFYKREGNNVITYAERWSDQYKQFKQEVPQEARGTPLEMLRSHGITPEQLSLCRAVKIYSIEALDALDGPNLKSLGMNANRLKEIARSYLEDRSGGAAALREIEELKRQIAELRGVSTVVPEQEESPEAIAVIQQEADEELYGAMTEDELRALIFDKTGVEPDKRLGHAKLVNLAKGM